MSVVDAPLAFTFADPCRARFILENKMYVLFLHTAIAQVEILIAGDKGPFILHAADCLGFL